MHTRKKVSLAALAWIALSATFYGQINPTTQQEKATKLGTFEVTSVKRSGAETRNFHAGFTQDGFSATNAPLLMVLRIAYNLFGALDDRFINLPDWAKTERFDIEGRVSPEDVDAYKKADAEEKRQMLQALLADRFKLQAHLETREQAVYLLVEAKSGSKLIGASPQEIEKPSMSWVKDQIDSTGMTMAQLAPILTQLTQRTVIDKTDLKDKYDIHLHFAPERNEENPDPTGPSIFTAVQEQLGLKLEPSKGPVDCLVIDHVERPTEN